MLKAKIKEKLLNRRNDVEIDELLDSSGNNVETKLSQLDELLSKVDIQENGLQISYYVAAENSEFGDIHVSDGFGGSGNVYLTNLLYLVDEEENPLFPLENNAGKVLAVNESEDGLEAVSLPSGGTQLYKHQVSLTLTYSGGTRTALLTAFSPDNRDWSVVQWSSAQIIGTGTVSIENDGIYIFFDNISFGSRITLPTNIFNPSSLARNSVSYTVSTEGERTDVVTPL